MGFKSTGQKLWCHKCCIGEFIRDQFDFIAYGFVTPVIDISGVTLYVISMVYQCNYKPCRLRCKANNGELYHQIPSNKRKGYPVDPQLVVNNEIYLTCTVTKLMEKNLHAYSNDNISVG